jgi:hypothetical protein
MKLTDITNENDEFTTVRYVMYINGKPTAHYNSEAEAQEQRQEVLRSMKKNRPGYPIPAIDIKKKLISKL